MPERADVFERTQIGFQTGSSAVAATIQLLGTRITPDIENESKSSGPKGARVNTNGVQNKESSVADIEQDPAQYTEILYLLASLFGRPSTSLVSSGVYLHEWDPATFSPFHPQLMTVQDGSYVRAERFDNGIVTNLTIEGSRDGISVSGGMIGRRLEDGITLTAGTPEVQTLTASGTVSGGTYTLAVQGHVTSALAYNANTAAIQAALDALANVDSGDIVVAGGALPGTPATFTFGGRWASEDVPMIVVDGASLTGSTPAYTMTQTTPGAPLTQGTLQPMSGNEWDLYLDTASGSIGNTQLTRAFGWSIEFPELYVPFWTGNTSLTSWTGAIDVMAAPRFTMRLAADATGMANLTYLRSGAHVFPRVKVTGPTLGASTYLFQADLSVFIDDPGSKDPEQGLVARTWGGEIQFDRTWKKWASLDLRNGIATIS